jgi:hypothetical protein
LQYTYIIYNALNARQQFLTYTHFLTLVAMKKISNQLCVLMLLGASLIFSSCRRETAAPEPDPYEIITVEIGDILVHDNVTVYNNLATKSARIENAAVHQFYSVRKNKRYSGLEQAKAEAAEIDFMHGLAYEASGGRMLVSPDSPQADSLYGDASDPANVKTWSQRSQVRFKPLTMTEEEFNAIENETRILAETADGLSQQSIRHLRPGSVFAFQLQNGRKGIARVLHVFGNPAYFDAENLRHANGGSVTLRVKIQK